MSKLQKAVAKRRRRAARKDASNYAKKNLFKRQFPTSTPKGRSWAVTRAIGNLVTLRFTQGVADEVLLRARSRTDEWPIWPEGLGEAARAQPSPRRSSGDPQTSR